MLSLKGYSVNSLIAIAKTTKDTEKSENIRNIIIEKYLSNEFNPGSFMKIYSKFLSSNGIMKGIMADLLIIYFSQADIYVNLDEEVCLEIVKNAQLDVIGLYGQDIKYELLKEQCTKELWKQAEILENKELLNKKNGRYRRRKLIKKIKKGD